jgi:hypothetical protein
MPAPAAARALRAVRPVAPVDRERKRMAFELLGDIRRLDTQHATIKDRIATAVTASGTTVTEIHGVGQPSESSVAEPAPRASSWRVFGRS